MAWKAKVFVCFKNKSLPRSKNRIKYDGDKFVFRCEENSPTVIRAVVAEEGGGRRIDLELIYRLFMIFNEIKSTDVSACAEILF